MIGPTVNEDIMVYEGASNEIEMNRVYEIDFICTYDMQYYPFDIQVCTVDMIMAGSAAMFVDLKPGDLKYSGPKTVYLKVDDAVLTGVVSH